MRLSEKRFNKILQAAQNLGEAPKHFRQIIESLTRDQQRELLAIIWLGRGDYQDWYEAVDNAPAEPSMAVYLAEYLAEKTPLAQYLKRGWAVVPYKIKSKLTNDTADKLNEMLAAYELVWEELQDYLLTTDERPDVSFWLLAIFNHTDDLFTSITKEPGQFISWYVEKTSLLKKAIKNTVDYWLKDHPCVQLRPDAPLTAREWIREGLLDNLHLVHVYAQILRDAVLEHEIELIETKK